MQTTNPKQNMEIMKGAITVLRTEFPHDEVVESVSRFMDKEGNFTPQRLKHTNLVDMKLHEVVSKLEWMAFNGDVSKAELANLQVEDYVDALKRSFLPL
ncbi:MAG: hypothetical protein ACREBF_00220 [Candidatus Micrarchaeales archaeon]